MLEYVNENGESYTEDEINQFAKDNKISIDEVIKKNKLTAKKQSQTVKPGKQKTVAEKDVTVTGINTASKSGNTSSVSKKRKSLFDQGIETFAPDLKASFEESMNKTIQKKKKEKVAFETSIKSKGIPGTGSNEIIEPTIESEKDLQKTIKESSKDKYYRLQQLGNGLHPSLSHEEGDVAWDENGLKGPSKSYVQKVQDEAEAKKQEEEDSKLNNYSDKLGDSVWSTQEDLNNYQNNEIWNALIPDDQKNQLGSSMAPVKLTSETSVNPLGIADQSQEMVIDWSTIPDGDLIIKGLPTLQNKWITKNGQVQLQNDQAAGIDPYAKALNNGKLFLSTNEKNLQKNQSLLLLAKKNNNKSEIDRLQNEIQKQRDELSLGGNLYDPATGKLLTVTDKRKVIAKSNEKAKQIANDTPYTVLNQMQAKTYYELLALSKEAYKRKDKIYRSETGLEKIGTFLKSITPGISNGYYDDVKNLESIAKTGYLPKTLNELPGKHPISAAFNKKLQQYITLTKAMELNNDPITTESNSRAVDFLDQTFKAFTNQGHYSAVGPVNRKEAAVAFNDMMATAGFEYKNKDVVDKKVEQTWKDIAIGSTAEMTPLIAAMFLTKKVTGPQITQAGNIATKVVQNSLGNTKAVNTATRLFIGGLSEAAHMKIADKVLQPTTGAPATDGTFAFSLGVGNVVAEDLIKTMVTKKIPFVTPVLATLATKSKLGSKVGEVALGAAIGTATMKVAEGAALVKDQLLAKGQLDQAKQWEELTDKQHLAGTFWSMTLLGGFAPKGFYDALKSDIKSIPVFNTESIRAGKLLDIDHKLPDNTKDLVNRDNEIDTAEQKALDNLNKKYKNSTDFETMAKEEVEIRKAANVLRGDLEIKNAKLNIEAGHENSSLADVWVATNKLKYGEQLNGADAHALSITPSSIIKNQLGLNSNDPLYKFIKREQQEAESYGKKLDDAGIFGDTEERKELLGNYFKARDIYRKINDLKIDSKSNPAFENLNNSKIQEFEKQLEELNNNNNELLESHKVRTDRDFNIDLQAAIDLAEKTGKTPPVQYGTTKEFIDAYKELNEGKEPSADSNAFFHNGVMHINVERGKEQRLVGTSTHEGTHSVLSNWMKDEKGNLTQEGVDFIDDWKNKLSPKERKVIDDRINENYKYDKDEEGNIILSTEKDKKEYYEEYLTAFVEAVREGKITYKSDSFAKLKAPFEKILSSIGFKNPKFLPGEKGLKEMYDMLKDIAESGKQGKASEMAVEFANKRGEAPENGKISFSKAKAAEVQKKIDKLEDQFDNDEIDYDTYSNNLDTLEKELEKAKALPEEEIKPVIKKEELSDEDEVKEIIKSEKGSISSNKVQEIYDKKGISGADEIINLFKPITKRIVDKRRDAPGFDRELFTDEIETGKGGILDLISKYDPKQGTPLAAYINKYLPVRAIATSRRLLDSDFKKDITEEKGLMAEETASEAKEKPKYKNALESKVFEPEVLKTMSDKVLTTLRTLKSRIDAPISLNRTVTPLIAEIRDSMGKQLDIDVKKAMGGKKDNELVNWLLKNKRYMLENMTTTWLMGANGQGGIPQAIQKRIDGKWVSYPEWVDKKIDRESVSTDNAGRTSGAELVRRLPNVFNNVSDTDYLGQFVGPDGNPLRGRKESGAKAVAEELAFDLIIKDFEEDGPLSQALSTNQERLGIELSGALEAEFNRQVERGNVKFSKTSDRNTALFLLKEGNWNKDYPEFVEFKNSLRPEERRSLNGFLNGTKSLQDKYDEVWNRNAGVRYEKNTYSALRTQLKGYLNKTGIELKETVPDRFNSLKPDLELVDKKSNNNTIIELKSNARDYMGSTSNSYFLNSNSKFTKEFEGLNNLLEAQKANKSRTAFINNLIKLAKEGSKDVKLTEGGGILISNKLYKELDRIDTITNAKIPVKALADINPGKDVLQIENVGAFAFPGSNMAETGLIPILKGDIYVSTEFRTRSVGKGWRNLIERAYFNLEPNFSEKTTISLDSTPEKFLDAVKYSGELVNGRRDNNTSESTLNSLTPERDTKGIGVFDFDDTVGLTKSNVLYTMPDGSTGKLNGAEFAREGSKLLSEGAQFDFSEFSKVVEGRPGPMVEKLKKMLSKFGNKDMFILTARPADSAGPIKAFLDSIGIDIPIENITGLGNSSPQAKADWMVEKANQGYNDFYFADDHLGNVDAVRNALDVLDVKSKIQQARAQFSKSLSRDFNQIIEDTKGIESYKVFSDVVARRRGAKKNKLDLYVPPSAADFELLLYNFMGKGAKGEEHKKFFNDALLKPYINGNDLMDAARQSIKREYKKLNNQFPEVRKELEKLTPDGDFTYDQAIRVSIWSDNNVEIPGLSKRDQRKLTDLVNNDPELSAFKQGLIITGRQGKGWIAPGEHWDSSTIISDLHNLTEGEGRKKFLGEFIDNAKAMFGEWDNGKLVGPNMNKIEAVYGTNVREALEDSIYRMTTGKNRSFGKDAETSRWSNWVNGSTGTIMFLNTRSAALQLLGAVNFLNFRDNNPIAAAKAFANQPQYWKDFARIWNSDKMKERRGGLKEDVAAAEIANAAAGSKNKVNAVVSYLLKIGYTPTQIADSFAIASGGAPFYRNRIKSYQAEYEGKPSEPIQRKYTDEEAEKLAWQDFTKVSDETQQSGDPKDISKQQASGAGRLLLTFQNTAMQQSRIVKKAYLDLKNGRGDVKTNISKIVYYLTVQNLMFSALQQGLFAVAFGNETDDSDDDKEKAKKANDKNKKLFEVADGVLDSILRGTGFIGGITATTKNMILKYMEEHEKKQADYAKVAFEFANISPPVGSKLKKLYSGLNQTKYDKDLIEERGWGIMQDGRVHLGPMYSVTGKVVEATTNLPMDRLQNKIENVSQALNSQNEAWQRMMIAAGWSPYSVGIEGTPGDLKIQAAGKAQRKEEGKIKAEESRERKRDSIKNLPFGEQLRLKREAKMKRMRNKSRKMG
jgi:hypothetical protein